MFRRSHLIARVVCALAIVRMSVAGTPKDIWELECFSEEQCDYLNDAGAYLYDDWIIRLPTEARASNSSAASVSSGYVRVVGFRDGTTPDGAANSTIAVAYNIEGLDAAVEFRVEMEDGPPSFCEDLQPGQVDADYPDLQSPEVSEGAWHQVAATSDAGGGSEGVAYVDVGFGIEELFDHPVVLYDTLDAVLACGILTQLAAEEDSTTEAGADDIGIAGTSSSSLPRSGTYPLVRFLIVGCIFMSYFCL